MEGMWLIWFLIYIGTIPKEMISSFDGSLKGAVLFCKGLNDTSERSELAL